MSLKVAFPGRAQPKKKVRIKHEHFFMFARLKTL